MINPANKKEWQDYTLRNLNRDNLELNSEKLLPINEGMIYVVPEEIGYFEQATKHWIHSRLDMNDV